MSKDISINQIIKEMESMSFSQIMDLILNDLHISCEDDIDRNLNLDEYGFIVQDLIDEPTKILLYLACKRATKNAIKAHANQKQFFFHKHIYFDENTDYINTYATLFPGRFVLYTPDIYLNGKLSIEKSKKTLGMNIASGTGLIRYYVRHKELLKNEEFFIFPQSVFDASKSSKYVTVPNLANRKNKCFLDIIENKLEIIPKTNHLNLILELPWLKNARIEDFFELREKYKTEYEHFLIQTDKLMLASKNGKAIESILAKEYNEAALEIRNTMLKQKTLLKNKGLDVALGAVCTIVPIALEQVGFDLFDPKILSSVVGGTTVYNGIKQFFEISNMAKENPYWILYQWEEKTNRLS
ncbi:MAG: hypothetical protein E7521_06610 [Ruminococcaceae bacterium]|nr:hypothetical protein [Oscillospiraceae bacterium]